MGGSFLFHAEDAEIAETQSGANLSSGRFPISLWILREKKLREILFHHQREPHKTDITQREQGSFPTGNLVPFACEDKQ